MDMYFTILCLITILATAQTGPLPKLRHSVPKWSTKLKPIKIMQNSKEAFAIPHYRKFDTIVHFEEPSGPIKSIHRRSIFGKKSLRSNDASLENGESEIINNIRSILGRKEITEINDNHLQAVFEKKGHDEIKNVLRSIFGKNDFIYLTEKKKRQNNLLNIVDQLVENGPEIMQSDQDGRDVMEVSMGLKRGLRRQGGLLPKLVYEFNELVE